jgi:hypothetical protein
MIPNGYWLKSMNGKVAWNDGHNIRHSKVKDGYGRGRSMRYGSCGPLRYTSGTAAASLAPPARAGVRGVRNPRAERNCDRFLGGRSCRPLRDDVTVRECFAALQIFPNTEFSKGEDIKDGEA